MQDLFFGGGAGWFTVLAICGTSVFLGRLVLLMFGHHAGDLHADVHLGGQGADQHADPGEAFKLLSLQSIAAMAMGFGWGGLAALKGSGLALPGSLLVAAACGAGMVWLLAVLLKALHDLHSSGNINIVDAVGREGDVYVSVPVAGQGEGQVRITIGTRQRIYNATSADVSIPTNGRVRVLGVGAGNTLTVVAIETFATPEGAAGPDGSANEAAAYPAV